MMTVFPISLNSVHYLKEIRVASGRVKALPYENVKIIALGIRFRTSTLPILTYANAVG